MKIKVWFYLTKEQVDAMKPMWYQGVEDNEKGKMGGAILLQPFFNGHSVEVRGQYLSEEYAEKVNEIIKDYNAKKTEETMSRQRAAVPKLPKPH